MSLALQRFEGTSIETALANAVRTLGGGLKVHEAKRVRKGGVMGFFAREHFEVYAEPAAVIDLTAPASAIEPTPRSGTEPALRSDTEPTLRSGTEPAMPAAARIDATLRALVEDVEARETPSLRSGTQPALSVPTATPIIDIDPEPEVALPARLTDEDLAPLPSMRPEATFYDFEELDAIVIDGPPRWTRKALRDLGIPAAILRSLPQATPKSDKAWTRALERAIAKHVPAPVVLGDDAPVQVSARGAEGALALIRAGVAGFPPGLLHVDGSAVAATAGELARAVRSCLPR